MKTNGVFVTVLFFWVFISCFYLTYQRIQPQIKREVVIEEVERDFKEVNVTKVGDEYRINFSPEYIWKLMRKENEITMKKMAFEGGES